MKIFNIIKNYRAHKFIKHQLAKSTVSPQGECFIKYLIDVYVNCSTEETIEHYEKSLDNVAAMNEKDTINFFPNYYSSTPRARYLMRKMYAASTFLIILLSSLSLQDREKWLNYIQNEERRNYYINSINNI